MSIITILFFHPRFIIYVSSIFVMGLIVPYNDPALLNNGATASSSIYVIAMNKAGVKIVSPNFHLT